MVKTVRGYVISSGKMILMLFKSDRSTFTGVMDLQIVLAGHRSHHAHRSIAAERYCGQVRSVLLITPQLSAIVLRRWIIPLHRARE